MADTMQAEPGAWTRWVSQIADSSEPSRTGPEPLRCVETGILFDAVVVARTVGERAVARMKAAGARTGPIAAHGRSAQILVPLGADDYWDRLLVQLGVPNNVAPRILGTGSLLWLPPHRPTRDSRMVWLVAPSLDERGLPVLTDPHDLVLALCQEEL